MNEEIANRLLRTLVIMVPILAILLAFVITFAFPRGIRITLARRSLWLAPPAVPIYSYFQLAAQYRRNNAKGASLLARARALHDGQDALTLELGQIIPELPLPEGVVEVNQDPGIQIVVTLLEGIARIDKVHRAAFLEAAVAVDELLAQPVPRTIPGIFQDQDLLSMYLNLALQANDLRNQTFSQSLAGFKSAIHQVSKQTQRLDALQATIDEIGAELQSLGDQADELGDQVELTTQPGRGRGRRRGRTRTYTEKQVRDLYDAFLRKPTSQSHDGFCTEHGIPSRQQMYQLFDREGLEWRSKENQ